MTERNDDTPKLRHEFVALLFAVAIAEVANQAVHRWEVSRNTCAYWAHLILMTVMISASWVGWSRARAGGARQDADAVYSRNFLILLLDVVIVIIYFFMVKGVKDDKSPQPNDFVESDCLGMLLVFGCYFLWDILVSWGTWAECWRMMNSGICTVLISLAWLDASKLQLGPTSRDMALLGIVLLFRVWAEGMAKLKVREGKDLTCAMAGRALLSGWLFLPLVAGAAAAILGWLKPDL